MIAGGTIRSGRAVHIVRRRFASKVLPALGASTLLASRLLASVPDDPAADSAEHRYYVAAIAAASASLQLHDTVAARRWLDAAPEAHRGWEWSFLNAEADRSSSRFVAHEGPVTDMGVSPDGKHLVTTGAKEATLWDAATASRVRSFEGHGQSTWNARFSPDGARLATVSTDGTLRIWETATGKELHRADDIGSGVAAVAWSPDGARIATASWKRSPERGVRGVVDIWDSNGATRVHRFEHGVKPIASVNFGPDGSRLFVGTWDFDVGVYETGGWTEIHRLSAPDDGIYKAVHESRLDPDGSLLAVAQEDGAVRIWDAKEGRLLRTLHRQAEGAHLGQNDVAWFPDRRRIAAASNDLTIRIWDATNGEHIAALHGHARRVTALALTPDGATLFSGDAGGEVRRWDLAAVAPERHRWMLPDVGYSVSPSHDGRRVASTGWGGWIVVLDSATGNEQARWEGHGTSGVRAAWSPDDRYLATTGNDGAVKVWDMRETPPSLLFEREVGVQSLAVGFSHDGRFLASPCAGPALKVWSVPDGREIATLDEGVAFSDGAWHPARPVIAAGGVDGVVRIWSPESGEVSARLEGHGAGALQVAFSADGRRLAAASGNGMIRIWNADTGARLHEMSVPTGGSLAAAFSPDGRRLATGGRDDHVHVWDAATGAHLFKSLFSSAPWEIAWSKDGRRLLVIPLDKTIRVLDAGANRRVSEP